MDLLESVAEEYEMDWVMLTVFKGNTNALRFYEKLGYSVDDTSPTKESDATYLILSKEIG